MENEKESLNYDCNFNLFLAKRLIGDVKRTQDRHNAIKWLEYLMKANGSVSEMKLRNDFMYYLISNLQEGKLRPPFNTSPPTNIELSNLSGLIPSRSDGTEENSEDFAKMFEDHGESDDPIVKSKSPDGGAFLALQPVPHEGSFCYLAITASKKDT